MHDIVDNHELKMHDEKQEEIVSLLVKKNYHNIILYKMSLLFCQYEKFFLKD
jgi:hypothetical protein